MTAKSSLINEVRADFYKSIHMFKEDFGLDTEQYQENLKILTGKTSCTDMTMQELYFVRKNFFQAAFEENLISGSAIRSMHDISIDMLSKLKEEKEKKYTENKAHVILCYDIVKNWCHSLKAHLTTGDM